VKLERRAERDKERKRRAAEMRFAKTFRISQPNESDEEHLFRRSASTRRPLDDKPWAWSIRQLRVSERVERALQLVISSDYKMHMPHARLLRTNVEIDSVRMSRDLRYARIFWSSLDPQRRDETYRALGEATPHLRHLMAQRVPLKYVPEFQFQVKDTTAVERAIRVLDKVAAINNGGSSSF
jgi:ribosome-binding factor A